MAPMLLSLPTEARHRVLAFCGAIELARLETACSTAGADIVEARSWQLLPSTVAFLLQPVPAASSFRMPNEVQHFWRRFKTIAPRSGRFFYIGGFQEQDEEEYLPKATNQSVETAADEWRDEAPMAQARGCGACAVDRHGSVWFAGGWNGRVAVPSVDCFCPSEGSWKPAPPLLEGVCYPGISFDTAGSVYVIGGGSGPYRGAAVSQSVSIYSPNSARRSWEKGPPLPEPRCGLAAAAPPNDSNRIFAVGGFSGDSVYLATATVLDVATQAWLPVRSMRYPRTGFGLAFGPDGALYAACGSKDGVGALSALEAFDSREGTWQRRADSLLARGYCTAAFSGSSGALLVAGGSAPGIGPRQSMEMYDVRADRWRLMAETEGVVEGASLAYAWG